MLGTIGQICLGLLLPFIESLRLEKTSKIIKFNHQPITTVSANPCPEVPHLHVYMFFEHLQWEHHFPGQPVSMPDNSFSKEFFP